MGDFSFQTAKTDLVIACLAPRAGFEPATRSRLFSSVARVTAVHTLGRLPQAADRAILPLRTPRIPGIGREPGIHVLGKATRKSLQA